MRGRFKKKVYRQVAPSTNKSPGDDRRIVEFGYLIIPDDIDREDYINNVLRTGLAMVITHYHEVVNNVMVPRSILREITFPEQSGQYGALVSLITYKEYNQTMIGAIFNKPGQYYGYQEGVVTDQYTTDENGNVISIISNINIPSHSITINADSDKAGVITISAKSGNGVSKITLDSDGNAIVEGDGEVTIKSSQKVSLGQSNAVNPVTLGDQTTDYLVTILQQISSLAGSVGLANIVTEATQAITELQQGQIKSTKVFTE